MKFPKDTMILVESKTVDLSGMEFGMMHIDGLPINEEVALLSEEATENFVLQLGHSFSATIEGRVFLEASYFNYEKNNPFTSRPIDRAVGSCPECGDTRHWYNNSPLTAYCWGNEHRLHKEWSKEVPYGEHLFEEEFYSPFKGEDQ
jgi:hypothetical protein